MGWKAVKKVKKHPIEGAELVLSGKGFPPDVDRIILAHHEKPDGSGYPKGLSASAISPLACVFIIAEDFVSKAHDKSIDSNFKEQILDEFVTKYSKGNFKQVLEGFKKFITL